MDPAEEFTRLADLLPEPMLLVSGDGAVLATNRRVARIFGLSPAELIGRNLDAVTVESPAAIGSMLRAWSRSSNLLPGTLTLLGNGGSPTPFRCEGAVFRARSASAPAVILIRLFRKAEAVTRFLALNQRIDELTLEVSRRRKLERDLREQSENLAEADRRKDEFLAMLAHELRNPLAPLLSGSHVLLSAKHADPVIRQIGEMMERQTRHLVRLIDDLLDVSRITRGTVELKRVPVSLRPLLLRSVEMVDPLIAERKHELSVTLPSESLCVDADATRLAQVFANLLSNAAKFTEPGGQISLHAGTAGSTAVVRVRDSGLGISADMLPKVFELFSQGDKSLERTEGGLGLGLTVVKELVEMHNGSVEAHSEGPGLGSEFIVRLPALSRRGGADAADDVACIDPAGEPARARRVLIVDDNRDAAAALALLIGGWNCEVRLAYTGTEALALAASFLPELILLDIGLPGMDGYDVARRLRSHPDTAEAVLVAVTGYGGDEDRRRCREAGFDEHMVKPVAAGALRKLLDVGQDTR